MDADWSVELGADDAALEFPWASPDGSLGYVDLSSDPSRVQAVAEAAQHAPLAAALTQLNASDSPWLSVKCDTWSDADISEAEAIYGGSYRAASYIDLIRRAAPQRFSFEQQERWVKFAAKTLQDDDEDACSAEFIVRRCYFHSTAEPDDSEAGFCITAYVFGYGAREPEARQAWGNALRRVSAVLLAIAD